MADDSALPDFLVIGAARCGTSSLFANLRKHQSIVAPVPKAFRANKTNTKEIHFFDKNSKYYKGMEFYKTFFMGQRNNPSDLVFEATPNYLFVPEVPARIEKSFPHPEKLKFIVMLRNPVDRAWSHYCGWQKKCGWRMDALVSPDHEIIKKGFYDDQLKRWFKIFDRAQFLIIRSEDFFIKPRTIIKSCFDFLGVDSQWIDDFTYYDPIKTYKRTDKLPVEYRRTMKTIFKAHTVELEEMLGRSFAWSRRY